MERGLFTVDSTAQCAYSTQQYVVVQSTALIQKIDNLSAYFR